MLQFKKKIKEKHNHNCCEIIRDANRNYVCPNCPVAEAIDDGFGTTYWCTREEQDCADVVQEDCNMFREEAGVPLIDWYTEISIYKSTHGVS